MGAHARTSKRRLEAALAVTATYMVVEAAAGLWSGSLALLSDAAHMLSDAGALLVALLAVSIAETPPDSRHTMGHQRAEVLGAALNAGALVVLSAWVAVSAVGRLLDPRPVHGGAMIAVAAVGLAVNVAMAALLAGGEGLNQRAAMLNVVGDALGSLGALVAGVLVRWQGWLWADAVASLAIAVAIVVGAVTVLRTVADVLMQGAPEHLDVAALERRVAAVPGVRSVHDLFVWVLRPGEDVVSVHVVVEPAADAADVCARVERSLREHLPSAHVTVQPERGD